MHFTGQGDDDVDGGGTVLDIIAGLQPQVNLALGDFIYKAGIEQRFCNSLAASLSRYFPTK